MFKKPLDKVVSRRTFLKAAAGGSALMVFGITPLASRAFAQDAKELSLGLTWEAAFRPTQDEFDKNFMDKHPDITLNKQYNTWGDHQTIVPTWAAAGTLPDIVYVHGSRGAPWTAEGIITDIDDLANGDAEFNVSDIWEEALRLYKPQGAITAVPYDHGPILLGYNKDIFDAAGHAYPDGTWTMEDFRAAAIALTDTEKGIWGWSGNFPDRNAGGQFLPWGAQFMNEEETQLTLDTPEMLTAIQFWADLIHVDKVAPTTADNQAFPSGPWQGGVVAMSNVASWDTPTLAEFAPFAWDVAPWPAGTQKGTGSFGSGFGICHPENRDTGWAYLREYLNKEGMEFMWGASGRGSPARQSAYDSWLNSPIAPEHASAYLDALKTYAMTDRPFRTLKAPELLDITGREVDLIKNGDKSVADALAAMQKDGQALLDS